MNEDQYLIAKYIKDYCLESPKEGFYLGKLPGARYKSQYYLSRLLYNTELMDKVCGEFVRLVKEKIGNFDFQICGREWSAIPLIVHVSRYLYNEGILVNSFMVKRKMKSYGNHSFIEGIPNEKPCLIMDDVCNSTNSFIHIERILRNKNIETVPFIFAVLDKFRYEGDVPEIRYDRYLGSSHETISILTGDDIAASIN